MTPPRFWTNSLKTRISLVALGVFLVSIWSLSFYASRMLREDMQRLLGEQQFSTVSLIAGEINDELDNRLRTLEKVAQRITPAMMADAPALQAFLSGSPALHTLFNAGNVIFDARSTALADFPAVPGRVGVTYKELSIVRAALDEGKSSFGKPMLSKTSSRGNPIIGFGVPIRNAQGMVIGVLAGVTDLSKANFMSHITQNRYGKTGGYILVAPKYRLIVTATEKSLIMTPLANNGTDPLIERFIQGYEGTGILINPLGVEVLASAKGVPVAGWYVAAALPTDEAFAPIRTMQLRMLLATLLLTLLAGGLTWWLLKRQLLPLLTTVTSLATMTEANQPLQALPIARSDEIGQLLAGFNRLLEILGEREQALKESEARYRLLADHVSDVLWVLNLEQGRTVYVSPSVERLRGYAVQEVLAQPVEQVMTAASYANVQTWIAERSRLFLSGAEGPHAYLDEVEQTRKDGSTVWTEAATRYIRNERGELTVLGVSRDISERKRLEREREQYFRFFLLTTDAMCIADPFGCFRQVNPAMVRLTGYSESELVAKPFLDFVLAEDRQRTAEEMKLQVAVRPSMQFENRYVCKDGRVIFLSWTAYYDNNDNVTYATARDITRIKEAERSLQESESRFRRMFEHNDAVMLLLDSNSREIVDANAAAAGFYGYSVERLKTMRIDQINNLPQAEVAANLKQATAHEHNFFVFPHRLAGGEIRTVEVRSSPVEVGGRVLVFSIVQDVTERERVAADLKRSNAELEQFSYSISHDMRQPLRMISSYLQLLELGLADKLDAEKREYLNFAADGARRLDLMLVKLLEYSRVGRKGEPPAWLQSRTLLDEALLFLQPAIAEARAEVRIEGDWPRIFVSPDELLRLLQNLIGNAIKFRVAGRTPQIAVASETVGSEWRVSVADNGVGILPDQIGRLFQVFQRLRSRADYEGTGIGLALCRKIAERHGGRIWAESKGEGEGSRFCFELPIMSAINAPLEPRLPAAPA